MSNKKLILVPGYVYKEGSFGVGPNYLEWLSQFGNARILMPWEKYVKADALFFPGGADLSPSSYGEVPGYRTGNPDVHKQYFYDNVLPLYIKAKMPVFGICLGMQALGVYFGSKLKQNLIYHPDSPDRWREGHKVKIVKPDESGFVQGRNKKGEMTDFEMSVNSHHHQGILIENLGQDLRPVAVHDETAEETVVEAFEHRTLKICGVQWHPEEYYDALSKTLFEKILS